jgi:hypothetical protein
MQFEFESERTAGRVGGALRQVERAVEINVMLRAARSSMPSSEATFEALQATFEALQWTDG